MEQSPEWLGTVVLTQLVSPRSSLSPCTGRGRMRLSVEMVLEGKCGSDVSRRELVPSFTFT